MLAEHTTAKNMSYMELKPAAYVTSNSYTKWKDKCVPNVLLLLLFCVPYMITKLRSFQARAQFLNSFFYEKVQHDGDL